MKKIKNLMKKMLILNNIQQKMIIQINKYKYITKIQKVKKQI